MPKVININKKPGSQQTRPKIYGGSGKDQPQQPQAPAQPAPKKQSFISRFLHNMLCDILHKFGRGPLATEEQQRWEDYERFCRMTRGEK